MESCWNHVTWQCLLRDLTEIGFRCQGALWNQVGYEAEIARCVLSHNDHGVAHAGLRLEDGLDLTEFDPVAANLDLIVRASKTFQRTIRMPTTLIPSIVHPCFKGAREGVGDEFLAGQLFAVCIAAGQTMPTDKDISRHAHGHRIKLLIEHIEIIVSERLPNEDRPFGRFEFGER